MVNIVMRLGQDEPRALQPADRSGYHVHVRPFMGLVGKKHRCQHDKSKHSGSITDGAGANRHKNRHRNQHREAHQRVISIGDEEAMTGDAHGIDVVLPERQDEALANKGGVWGPEVVREEVHDAREEIGQEVAADGGEHDPPGGTECGVGANDGQKQPAHQREEGDIAHKLDDPEREGRVFGNVFWIKQGMTLRVC